MRVVGSPFCQLEMDFDLNKSEFRAAVKCSYDWEVPDTPSVCVCGDIFNVDHRSRFDVQMGRIFHPTP